MPVYKKVILRKCRTDDVKRTVKFLKSNYPHCANDYDRILGPLFNGESILVYDSIDDNKFYKTKEKMYNNLPFNIKKEDLYEVKE